MGKFTSKNTGVLTGKVGNVVYTTWRGIEIIRSRPRKSNKPPSEAQLSQRLRMKTVSQFLSPLRLIINNYFNEQHVHKSAMNLATSYHLKEAVSGSYPDYQINFQKAIISKGELSMPGSIQISTNSGLSLSWDTNASGLSKDDDRLLFVFYNENENKFIIKYDVAQRIDSACTLVFPQADTTYQCWLLFYASDGKCNSNSLYLGPIDG